MANLLNSIIYHLKDAIVKDSNGDATVPHDLTVGNAGNFKHTTVQSANDNSLYTAKNGNASVSFGAWTSGTVGIYDSYKANNVISRNTAGDTYVHGTDVRIPPTGDIISTRGLRIGSATHRIGQRIINVSGATHSWNSSTSWVSLEQATLPAPGVYLCIGEIQFPNNSVGRRGVQWYSQTADVGYQHSSVVVPATDYVCYVQSVAVIDLDTSSQVVRLRGLQTSGSNLTVESYIKIIAIA